MGHRVKTRRYINIIHTLQGVGDGGGNVMQEEAGREGPASGLSGRCGSWSRREGGRNQAE